MKVFFPRNIPGGWLNISVQIGPVQVSLVQLVLLALGVGITLALANAFIKNGAGKLLAFIMAFPFFVICVVIAFFKYSELRIHEFLAKMIRTHFLDTTHKFQINYDRVDALSVALVLAKKADHDVLIQQKDLMMDEEGLERLKGF